MSDENFGVQMVRLAGGGGNDPAGAEAGDAGEVFAPGGPGGEVGAGGDDAGAGVPEPGGLVAGNDPDAENAGLASDDTWKLTSLVLGITTILFIVLFSLAGADVIFQDDGVVGSQNPTASPPDDEDDPDSNEIPLDPTVYGQWDQVVPEDNGAALGLSLGMQSVHTILLPSGRVLTAPGSSWRNWDGRTDYYPEVVPPNLSAGTGLFNRAEDPFNINNLTAYYEAVNNAAIYDPRTNEWFRIPHPVPQNHPDPAVDQFVPSDLFCSGQLQLPNGNPIFLGGTQYYFPYRTGTDATYIFDWEREANMDWSTVDWTVIPTTENDMWDFSGKSSSDVKPTYTSRQIDTCFFFSMATGFMTEGRWYPNAVPLMDGRLVIVSKYITLAVRECCQLFHCRCPYPSFCLSGGFIGFKDTATEGDGDMYQFEINKGVEFFDYRQFYAFGSDAAWKYVNVSDKENSPFSTSLPLVDQTEAANCEDATTELKLRECTDYKFDAFKLYPRMYLMPDGERIFFTRDGDYNSLRETSGDYMRNTRFTYLMNIAAGTRDDPDVSFERGPDLPYFALNSGSVVRDPNNPSLLRVTGGFENYGGTLGPGFLNSTDPRSDVHAVTFDVSLANHFLGSRATSNLLVYTMPERDDETGTWSEPDENYLGDTLGSARTMHYDIILPTKQLLVVGGGNFDFAQGVRYPLLYRPRNNADGSFTGEYDVQRMAESSQERLYHNTALLLDDGRVYMSGGNGNRASLVEGQDIGGEPRSDGQRKFNPGRVDVNVYFFSDGYMARGHKPSAAETWTAEIFSPPYLFIDGNRRTAITGVALLSDPPSPNYEFNQTIASKTHYLFHSGMSIRLDLDDLPTSCSTNQGSLALLKLGAATHGWDSGQQLHEIAIAQSGTTSVTFTTPEASEMQIIPGFYHLFYTDCRGKPTVALSVRFDDTVNAVTGNAEPA